LAVRSSALPALTTILQAILHRLIGITVAEEEDVMADMDKGERSISRILPARNPRCRVSKNYAIKLLVA
jgi:hypothetical protein